MRWSSAAWPQVMNINISRPPTNELAVRQGILYGVNRKAMTDLLFFGAYPPPPDRSLRALGRTGRAWRTCIPMIRRKPSNCWRMRAGRSTPRPAFEKRTASPLRIRHVTSDTYTTKKPAEYVQAALKEVGIDDVVEAMAYEASANVMRTMISRWRAWLYGLGPGRLDPRGFSLFPDHGRRHVQPVPHQRPSALTS